MANPMLDKKFLEELDQIPLKELYAEIIALNDKDEVLESIEGHVTQGTINIDGASSVRRTCSLTLVADELNIHEYYWGLHTKFKLALGIKNTINSKYPEIIWFKQGIFVISSFTTSQTTNNYTITIQGKDKMSKLNGEFGGMVTALTHNFGTVLETDKLGYTKEVKLSLKEIITAAVHQYANEPMYNIVVNDLEEKGLELLEYRGNNDLYLLINEETTEPENFISNLDELLDKDGLKINPKEIIFNPLFQLDSSIDLSQVTVVYTPNSEIPYTVAKITYGKPAGYRITDLVYAGELILNIGEPITAMLDKIVQMLGEYEYFYDIDGRFIFQKKKIYFNSSWNNIRNSEDEIYAEPSAYTSAISYSFEDGKLISSYTNNPNYPNIKNDFSVWGTRKSITGQELPIHMRYAIDEKPWLYVNYNGKYFTTLSKDKLLQRIKDEFNNMGLYYAKKKNPFSQLSEDWWDIFDWAEYYKLCTGDYPNEVMGQYLHHGGVQFTEEEMYSMFPKGTETSEYFVRNPIYIFDVESDGTLGYTNHGTNCTAHEYKDYFINSLQARGATAYIYKPELPKKLSDLASAVAQIEVQDNMEWREIIYQMAKDYDNNHLKEDFFLKIEKNNFNRFRKGITGYEQYYIDLLGFWRDLYDPDYIFHFENIELSRTTYEDYCGGYKEKDEEGNPVEFMYYYSKPLYQQCTPDMIFSDETTYYSYVLDEQKNAEVIREVSINSLDYAGNEGKYYYVSASEPTEIVSCLILEPYEESGKAFYRFVEENNEYKSVEEKIEKYEYYKPIQCTSDTEFNSAETYYISANKKFVEIPGLKPEEFKGNETKYYYLSRTVPTETAKSLYRIKSSEYKPCFEIIDYQEGGQGYYHADGAPYDTVKETEYYESPKDYWLKNYTYYQCGEDIPYEPGRKYYIINNTRITDQARYDEIKIIDKKAYEDKPDKYYIRLEEIIPSSSTYNSAETYYIVIPEVVEEYQENEKIHYYRKRDDNTYYQCASEDFIEGTVYYTLTLEPRIRLTSKVFNEDKEKYYRIVNTEYERQTTDKSFDEAQLYYTDSYQSTNGIFNSYVFNQDKTKYYTKEIDEYAQCTTNDSFQSDKVYYLELLTKDKDLTAEQFINNETQYHKAEKGYSRCTATSIYNVNTTYYRKEGNYKSCYIFNLEYDENETYYKSNRAAVPGSAVEGGGGGGGGGATGVTYTEVTIDKTYFDKKENKKYLYIKRDIYENCQAANLDYDSKETYYTRKLISAATRPGTSGNRPEGGGGGSAADDNHVLYDYTAVASLTEQEFKDNRFKLYVKTDNYTPQNGLTKSQFNLSKTEYYTYSNICRPCGKLKVCSAEDQYNKDLVYYTKKENNTYEVINITTDNFNEEKEKGLYYGVLADDFEKYVAGLTYYVLRNGIYTGITNVTKTEFEKDIYKYYYQYCTQCLEDDVFATDTSYYKYKKTKVENLKENIYEEAKEQYYYVSKMKYVQCTANSEYNKSTNYYTLGYTPVYTLTAEDFNKDKEKYSIRTKVEYQQCGNIYTKCTEDSKFDEKATYFKKNEDGEYIEMKFGENTFEALPDKTLYYTGKIEYYSSDTIYYIKIGETYIPKTSISKEEYDKYYNLYSVVRDIGNLYKCVRKIREYSSENVYARRVLYKQCDENSVFDKTADYYTIVDGEYKLVKDLTELQFNTASDKGQYYISLKEKIYEHYPIVVDGNIVANVTADNYDTLIDEVNLYEKYDTFEKCWHPIEYSPSVYFYVKKTDKYRENWHKNVLENPELLDFWFDFIGEDSELQKFGCHSIGNRPKGVNDNQVKAIYFRETPTVIFYSEGEVNYVPCDSNDTFNELATYFIISNGKYVKVDLTQGEFERALDKSIYYTERKKKIDKTKLGYTYVQLTDETEALFDISSQGKSAKTAVDNLIYQHACGAEQISISVLPIYHLEPNTRIFIRNDESGINGEYILVRYNLTLGTNGNMSITAAKAVDRIY